MKAAVSSSFTEVRTVGAVPAVLISVTCPELAVEAVTKAVSGISRVVGDALPVTILLRRNQEDLVNGVSLSGMKALDIFPTVVLQVLD